jgi:hypothetical protein
VEHLRLLSRGADPCVDDFRLFAAARRRGETPPKTGTTGKAGETQPTGNGWSRNWGEAEIRGSGDVSYGSMLSKKSFCITEHKFYEP